MGLDGFSMRNLAVNNDLPTSQLAMNSEAAAKRTKELEGKDVNGLSAKQKVDPDEKNNQEFFENDKNESSEDNDDDSATNVEVKNELLIESKSHHEIEDELASGSRRYNIKMSENADFVELIDSETGKIIEKIKPDDLVYVIKKLESASGMLVNKKV